MNYELNKFIHIFRELEQKDFTPSVEEEKLLDALKQKLITPLPNSLPNGLIQRSIAIGSLYPQTGSSFIASNLAYYHACSNRQTTLTELPSISPYFYFALDFAKRGHSTKSGMMIPLQQGHLRVKPTSPLSTKQPLTQAELTNWFVQNHKECSLFLIDISHSWQSEEAIQISKWVDEIWLVLDDNIPRFVSLVMSGEMPNIWEIFGDKVRLVANKWNDKLKQAGAVKLVEGTLSLWNQSSRHIDFIMPLIDRRRISQCFLNGNVFLEQYPDELKAFERMGEAMGHGGDL